MSRTLEFCFMFTLGYNLCAWVGPTFWGPLVGLVVCIVGLISSSLYIYAGWRT